MKGIDIAKERGEIRPEINSVVLAWTLMGASNFLGLNWGLFTEGSTDSDLGQVVESFMSILTGGIFTGSAVVPEEGNGFPIRIEVEFDDEEEADSEEEKLLESLAEEPEAN
jgi:hypothetical protein